MTGSRSTPTSPTAMAGRSGTPSPQPGCSTPMRTGVWRSSGCGCAATPTTARNSPTQRSRPRRSCSSGCATRLTPVCTEGQLQARAQPQVTRRSRHIDCTVRRIDPAMLSGGPILQLPGRNVHFHDSALASGQPHTVKADQCALGELHARGAVARCAQIDLRYFIASDGSAIAQLEAHQSPVGGAARAQFGIGEPRVTESKPEREQRCALLLVEPAVTNEQPFAVVR